MATVQVTETGVAVEITLYRDTEGVDHILTNAHSLTNNPQIQGRSDADDLTGNAGAIGTNAKELLDAVIAFYKGQWNIP